MKKEIFCIQFASLKIYTKAIKPAININIFVAKQAPITIAPKTS